MLWLILINPLTPNDPYRCRTAHLTSKFVFYIFIQQNISTKNFKHGIYSPCFSLQNAVCFIIVAYLVPALFTFYTQVMQNLKNNSGAKRLIKALNISNGNFKHRIVISSITDFDCVSAEPTIL